jgi:hypothetical protein
MNQYLESKDPKRKRDNQGNLIDSLEKKDIFVPFKCEVPPGTSTFEIQVPKTYLNRIFSFDNIMLISNLYAEQAQSFNEETEEELREILSYEIYIQAVFITEKKDKFYGPTYEMPTEIKLTADLIKQINTYYESNKPTGIVTTPVFFDWIDLRFEKVTDKTFDEYYQSMAPTYYGEDFDPAKHFNALPRSARKVFGVNNYLLPTLLVGEVLENVRLRINIAPNSFASFSTDTHLLSMGFDSSQYGNRKYKNDNFKIENKEFAKFWNITGNQKMLPELIVTPNKFKMFMEVFEENFISKDYSLQITKKDSIKNERFETELKNAFLGFEKTGNISYGVTYNETAKRFQFMFPRNDRMVNMKVVLPRDLAERLGFELNIEITPKNSIGEPLVVVDPKETEDRARALSNETGLIIVSDYNTGTNTTVGIGKQYMAALYPTETGNMVMHVNEICNQQPFMTLPIVNMTNEYIPVTFLLSRFLNNNKLVNLVWKEGFTMQGTMRGVHPFNMNSK